MAKEDRNLLMGHKDGSMSELYAASTVERLVRESNRVADTRDRMTLLRVVNG